MEGGAFLPPSTRVKDLGQIVGGNWIKLRSTIDLALKINSWNCLFYRNGRQIMRFMSELVAATQRIRNGGFMVGECKPLDLFKTFVLKLITGLWKIIENLGKIDFPGKSWKINKKFENHEKVEKSLNFF